jgi:hypothetical protein
MLGDVNELLNTNLTAGIRLLMTTQAYNNGMFEKQSIILVILVFGIKYECDYNPTTIGTVV